MKSVIHSPAFRQRMRKLRPIYNAVFRRRKDLSRLPTPQEAVRAMEGRGVMLFSFGRCGTTVFSDFLASHPQVVTFGEVLNEDSYYSYFQHLSRRVLRWWTFGPDLMAREFYPFLLRLVRSAPGMRCLFDLKLEGVHLVEGNWRLPVPDYHLFAALKGTDAPVILVIRRDLVARHVSGRIAEARQAYHSYHDARTAKAAPFAIDIERMERENAHIRAQLAHVMAVFADHPAFACVVYEEMFETDPGTGESWFAAELATRMGALLGVDPEGFQRRPQLQRMSGGSETSLVTNADAVQAARARQPDALA